MHICRFNRDRLGLVEDDRVFDVTNVLEHLPALIWPASPGDQLIANLVMLREHMLRSRLSAPSFALSEVDLFTPVVAPTKVMAVPANYRKHVERDTLDPGVDQGMHRAQMLDIEKPAYTYGLFLKANSALVGPSEGVVLYWPGEPRRIDHEVELAVVIGKRARCISIDEAMSYVAGYSIGLDMTVRGTEDRSFRKSGDCFAVLGPWLTTADEISDPDNLLLSFSVNGEKRQEASTREMTVGVAELISFASHAYTLYPGDIIMTGTPEGVGPVAPGDVMVAECENIGQMTIAVRGQNGTVR